MEIPVLVERVEGDGYRARGLEPFGVTGEGATQEEAVRKFREQVESRIAAGARLVQVNIPERHEHPWDRFFGTLQEDDPAIKQWEQFVEEYRREIDEDTDIS
jgi:hypothetical protein